MELPAYVAALNAGDPLTRIIDDVVRSAEFRARIDVDPVPGQSLRPVILPDLTSLYPERFIRRAEGDTIFVGRTDDDIRFMERMIAEHRYYESFGIWTPRINLDKHITAGIVAGPGAKTSLELGCFSGSVMSLLQRQGVDVTGAEISHLGFLLAEPDIYHRMRFGDLTDLDFGRMFDIVYAMDVLEHISPLRLDATMERIAGLTVADGFVYVNSPMFGTDDVFGTIFPPYVEEWAVVGDDHFWYPMHCDAQGWPMHGHLVWASPAWWERLFRRHGLVRDRQIERTIHNLLEDFFRQHAPARKSLFVLRHADATPPDHAATAIRLREAIAAARLAGPES